MDSERRLTKTQKSTCQIGIDGENPLGQYVIRNGKVVPEPDLMAWGQWMGTADRVVARTNITEEIVVSTVFLGLDHAWGGGKPVLWETMIFGGKLDTYQTRYTSRAAAEAGHIDAVSEAYKAEGIAPPKEVVWEWLK